MNSTWHSSVACHWPSIAYAIATGGAFALTIPVLFRGHPSVREVVECLFPVITASAICAVARPMRMVRVLVAMVFLAVVAWILREWSIWAWLGGYPMVGGVLASSEATIGRSATRVIRGIVAGLVFGTCVLLGIVICGLYDLPDEDEPFRLFGFYVALSAMPSLVALGGLTPKRNEEDRGFEVQIVGIVGNGKDGGCPRSELADSRDLSGKPRR